MDAALKKEWARFLAGHWTKERPTVPGRYAQADSTGEQSGVHGVIYIDPRTKEPRSVTSHGGYWWSEPYPELPPVDIAKWPPPSR